MKTTQVHTLSKDEWSRLPIIGRYQHFVRRKYQEMENNYYCYTDELEQKLADLGEIRPNNIPQFTLNTFSFIKDWQYGDVSTEYVYNILKGMNLPDVAEKTVCRRLRNFMEGKEHRYPASYEYTYAVHERLKVACVPLYLKYLELLLKYFEKMVEIDKSQIRMTWIEKIFKKNGEIHTSAHDITLNQAFREIDSTIIPNNSHRYSVGDHVLVFDEDLGNEDTICHWIFGPKAYIEQLKKEFHVTEVIDLKEEKQYIQNLIRTFVV